MKKIVGRGLNHTWLLDSDEAATTNYKTNGFWASGLIRPAVSGTTTINSAGAEVYSFNAAEPSFLNVSGGGWSITGSEGVTKRNISWTGDVASFSIFQGDLKKNVGTEIVKNYRNYVANYEYDQSQNPRDMIESLRAIPGVSVSLKLIKSRKVTTRVYYDSEGDASFGEDVNAEPLSPGRGGNTIIETSYDTCGNPYYRYYQEEGLGLFSGAVYERITFPSPPSSGETVEIERWEGVTLQFPGASVGGAEGRNWSLFLQAVGDWGQWGLDGIKVQSLSAGVQESGICPFTWTPPPDEPPGTPEPPSPPTRQLVSIAGTGEDHTKVMGKTFLSPTLTKDYLYESKSVSRLEPVGGYYEYLEVKRNIDHSYYETIIYGNTGLSFLVTEVSKTEIFNKPSSSQSAEANFLFYEKLDETSEVASPVNSRPSFVGKSTQKLMLNSGVTVITVPVNLEIRSKVQVGSDNNTPVYDQSSFKEELVGTPVVISQIIDANKCWLASGFISAYTGSENIPNFSLTSITVNVNTIEEAIYSSFASENGSIWCNNGSIVTLLLAMKRETNRYLDCYLPLTTSEIEENFDCSCVNLIGRKFFLSKFQETIDKKIEYVETWELVGTGAGLNLKRTSASKGNITLINSSVHSISYYQKA